MNYFELLNMPEALVLDEAHLRQQYLAGMQKCHPDNFSQKSMLEKKAAEKLSAAIAQAYHVLKEPLKRACHWASMQGIDTEHTALPPAFLMEQMAFREKLESASSAQDKHACHRAAQEACERYIERLESAEQQAIPVLIAEWQFFDKMRQLAEEKL